MSLSFLNLRICCAFLFAGSGCFVFSQNSHPEIDNLLQISDKAFDNYESQISVDNAKLALKKSELIGNSELIATSHYYIARALEDLGQQNESLKHLQSAEKEDYTKNNLLFGVKLNEVKGMNYMTLYMYPQAMEEFHKALVRLKRMSDNSEREIISSRILGNLYVVHRDAGNLDSAYYYMRKENNSLKRIDESKIYSSLILSYLDYGLYYLEQKKDTDSAQYFIEKSHALQVKYNDPYKQDVLRAFGDLYFEKKDYQKSLDYYTKSLNIMKQLQISDASYIYVYKRLANVYRALGDREKEKYYLDSFFRLSDSLLISKEEAVGSVVSKLLDEEKQKQETFRNRVYLILILISIGFVLKAYFMIRYYKKVKRRKEQNIVESNKLLKIKEEENKGLQQQLNAAFEEIVQMAKENNPEFLIRFQEVYPDFCPKLIELYPNLLASELKFCALLFLNFSSKDIAEFTFVTVKAVQNRKNRFRKKFNIPSEEDLNVWMQRICNSN